MANTTTASHLTPENTGFPLKLKKRYDNFIGGAWVAPVQGEYYTNLTPIDPVLNYKQNNVHALFSKD